MFASAAEYYRRHPYGDTSNDDDDDDENNQRDEDADEEPEQDVPPQPQRTTVRLSGAMFLEDALDRIREALNEKPVTTTRRLTCMNLGLDGLVFDEEELHKTLLARLLHSRDWESIELHACRRVGVMLDLLRMGHSKVCTLSLTGGERLRWLDVQSLAKATPHIQLHTLHLFMTLPKPPAPFRLEEAEGGKNNNNNEDPNDASDRDYELDEDDDKDNDDDDDDPTPQDPSLAMKLLVSGIQISLQAFEVSLSRRDVDTLGEGLRGRVQPPIILSTSATCQLSFGMLQRLDLRHSFLTDANVAQLVRAIVPLLAHGGLLRALDLRGHCECQSQTLQALAQPSAVSLKELWVSHTVLTDDPMEGLQTLLASLSAEQQSEDDTTTTTRTRTLVSSLEGLDLGNYMIYNADMEMLLRSLVHPSSSTLQRLNLLSCGMTSSGVALWEQALPQMTTLKRLSIPADASHSLLQGLLRHNTSLETLELERDGGSITDRKLPRPHDIWLDLNRGGRRLLMAMDGPPIPTGLWPLVLERAQTASIRSNYYGGSAQVVTVLWYLLRNRILLEQ